MNDIISVLDCIIICCFVLIFSYVAGIIHGSILLGKDYPVEHQPEKPIKQEHKEYRPCPTKTPNKSQNDICGCGLRFIDSDKDKQADRIMKRDNLK